MKKIRGRICTLLILVLVLSSASVCFAATGQQKIDASYNNIKVSVNGTVVTPKDAAGNTVEPFIYNGTTYLPVRAVSSVLGNDVSWDNATKTVGITASNEALDESKYFKILSDFWGAYNMVEAAKSSSDLAITLYGTSSLQTQSNIDDLLSSLSERRETMEKYRDNTYFQTQPIIKAYAYCDAAMKITGDNLKALKNGDTAQNCASKERINNNAIFDEKMEIAKSIYDTLQYVNQ